MNRTETKYQSNWQEKSLEYLEKDCWDEPEYESHLVKACHQLRKKPLKFFEIEDIRKMISQNIGLKFLIPLAIEKLSQNILTEGDYYEGDLLKAVLTSEKGFWKNEPKLTKKINSLILDNKELLIEKEPDLLKFYSQWKKN